jgi:hypothetical protein
MKLALGEEVLAAVPVFPTATPLPATPRLPPPSLDTDLEILEPCLPAVAAVGSCDVRPPAVAALADAEFWLLRSADVTT